MASNIDATKPQAGNAKTLNVRDNFAAAKNEIEALQAGTGQTFITAKAKELLDDTSFSAMRTTLNAASLGANTFTGIQIVKNGNPKLGLWDTSGSSGLEQAWIGLISDSLLFQTRDSAGSLISHDYIIKKNASGATSHQWRIANSEEMRLTSTGLGIGTSSVRDTLVIEDADPAVRLVDSSDSSYSRIFYDVGALFISADRGNTRANSRIVFNVDGSEAARIDSGGNVGIGLTNPYYLLDVNGAIGARELSTDPSDPDEGAYVMWMSDGTGTGDDGDILVKIKAGGTVKTATLVDFSAV